VTRRTSELAWTAQPSEPSIHFAMPQRLLSSRVPVELAIVEFDPKVGEELFLSCTVGREDGPQIKRTGGGPPWMQRIGRPADELTHHFAMRCGSWLIREEMRADEIEVAGLQLAEARRSRIAESDIEVLLETVAELPSLPSHEGHFQCRHPGYEVVGMTGCSNLTMNNWTVAFLNDGLTHPPGTLVRLASEGTERTYSCLVKWKSRRGPGRVTIEDVQFKRNVRHPNEKVWVRSDSTWLPRADRIEFAVSSQQVIRAGEVVPLVTTCHQFSDLRHLLQMPNLNPEAPLYATEKPARGPGFRPRQYFSRDQFADLWLGEEELLKRDFPNLLRAALSGPVILSLPPGSTEQSLHGALSLDGYREVQNALEVLQPGDWRFVKRNPQEKALEIYFRRNKYCWTMIGLTRESRRILCLAADGVPARTGFTVEQAAERLREAGAHDALVIDEALSVFQIVSADDGRLAATVRPKRGRSRAVFIFARPRLAVPDARAEDTPGALRS
jgi:hypothetical protein